jgi:Leucine-rich repeat (LRR) protein
MRRFIILVLCLLLGGTLTAQEDPNEIALRRILANASSGNTSLTLAGIGMTELPPEIGELTHLETLWLNHNDLTELPPEIGNLVNLQSLYISNNQLERLPAEIGNLTNLHNLDLSYNKLYRLPWQIGNLLLLDELHLQHNALIMLPHEMGNLTALYWLDISDNQLSKLPSEIGTLNLQYINISGNLAPLSEMAGREVGEILRYVANPNFMQYLVIGLMLLSIVVASILGLVMWQKQKKQPQRRRIRNRAA